MGNAASTPPPTGAIPHPDRKEIARYLLSRGIERLEEAPEPAVAAAPGAPPDTLLAALAPGTIPFPDGLAPVPDPVTHGDPNAALPQADVVVITWTVDEVAALAKILTPGHSAARWQPYARDFATRYAGRIRPHAPAANARRLGSYMPVRIGSTSVLCMKSELHLNQDGVKTGDGTATLPVKDLFLQIIAEAKPKLVLTVGTAGSVFESFALGDVVVTRGAKFRLSQEFRNEPFNGRTFTSDWELPTARLATAETLMARFANELTEPPFAPPTKRFPFPGEPIRPPANRPNLRLDGRDMPAFHPILTTDYFEYGTSSNRLDLEGAAVEMGDAALGLACSELAEPPRFAVVRNMSDPVINGDLPAKQFHLNEQTTWAVGYYTAYGHYTSMIGALATWGLIAGLEGA
jgi:nucleoside phosphorylase